MYEGNVVKACDRFGDGAGHRIPDDDQTVEVGVGGKPDDGECRYEGDRYRQPQRDLH
ncbi:MAG: hypothetical protein AAFO91_16585 [Bacteroidota bacterium]